MGRPKKNAISIDDQPLVKKTRMNLEQRLEVAKAAVEAGASASPELMPVLMGLVEKMDACRHEARTTRRKVMQLLRIMTE